MQVVHLAQLGATPATARPMMTSPEADFVLRPAVTATGLAGATLSVTIAPPIDRRQAVALLLNELGAAPGTTPAAFRINAPARAADDVATVDFDVTAIAAGDWLLRVEVDGAQSVVSSSVTGGPYDTPRITR